MHLVRIRAAARRERPLENLLVLCPFGHSLYELGVAQVEKRAAFRVKTLAEVWLIILRQFALGVEPG
ncbi:MAG TPA: hypothetical protein VF511_05050, partial [Chthoniobacterales bacterium]